MVAAAPLTIRVAGDDDDDAVIALLGASLGWVPDGRHTDFFRWKHRENPAGRSPAWVACIDDRIVGYRTMLRWQFRVGDDVVDAVRAVDTATHPDAQGRGIFTTLTRVALDELAEGSTAFVFNTPNEQSRPGYLKLGWQEVGRVPIAVGLRSVLRAPVILRARVPAGKWARPCAAGEPAGAVLADAAGVGALLASQPRLPAQAIATLRTPAHLRWRYGWAPLGYRVLRAGDGVDGGIAVFRVRQRGPAVEATVCELLVPEGDRRAARRLFRRVAATVGADFAVAAGAGGAVVPRLGPILTWKGVAAGAALPPLADWRLALGDVELL